MKTSRVAPSAASLIESMRDLGYTLETALADVIDNSIAAGAPDISLLVEPGTASPAIGVLDNGRGMTFDELLNAMRPGSVNPRDARAASDLGRFGLGLKTASFSQCRRVTVLTRHGGVDAAAIWDLKYVAEKDDWLVQIPESVDQVRWANLLGPNGTLVVWEDLDRVVDRAGATDAQSHFVRRLDEAREHLELVFHRFLSGESTQAKIAIVLNGIALEPFDPFHSRHPATVTGPLESIQMGDHKITVQCFTLPHHAKVAPSEWEKYGGRSGYLKNQGFYVYRKKRLILYGTWFGLARQAELTKLTRVRIDIPDAADAEWKIDVKKASAQPPYLVRERLRRIIETIGAPSRRVYTSRGRVLASDNRLPVWHRVQENGVIEYRLNPSHPSFAAFLDQLSPEQGREFSHVLQLAASSLPLDALFADIGGAPEKIRAAAPSDELLLAAVNVALKELMRSGAGAREAAEMLRFAEPYRSNWERTEAFIRVWISSKGECAGQFGEP